MVEPTTDADLRERLRLAEEAAATWKSWAEQRALEVEALNIWKAEALERQSIKDDHERIFHALTYVRIVQALTRISKDMTAPDHIRFTAESALEMVVPTTTV